MNFFKLFYCTSLLVTGLLCSHSISAQSVYYGATESGLHVGGQYTILEGEGANAYGATVGYVSNGRLNVGMSFDRQSIEFFNITTITPHIEYLILKQSDKTPVSLGINGAYGFVSISDNFGSFNTQSVGVRMYHKLGINGNISIIPEAGPLWNRVSGNGVSDSAFGLTIGTSVQIGNFYLRPVYAVGFGEDTTDYFTIGAGYTFGANDDNN